MSPVMVPKESNSSTKRTVQTQSQKKGRSAYFQFSFPDGRSFVSTMKDGPPGAPHAARLVTHLLPCGAEE